MPEQPVDELPRERFREKASGTVFEAARIYGWIVWDVEGPQLIEPGEFEARYEPAELEPE